MSAGYGHAMTLATPRCERPRCGKAAKVKSDETGRLLCGPHANETRCTRCGSKCLDADDCDLLLQDRLADHAEG